MLKEVLPHAGLGHAQTIAKIMRSKARANRRIPRGQSCEADRYGRTPGFSLSNAIAAGHEDGRL
jgi:hypothetical protein